MLLASSPGLQHGTFVVRRLFAFALLFVGCLSAYFVAAEESVKPEHSLVISTDEAAVDFGQANSLTVSYRNDGQKPWLLRTKPDTSSFVWLMHRRPKASKSGRSAASRSKAFQNGGFSLGQNTSTTIRLSDGEYITMVSSSPPLTPISIAAGEAYTFQTVFQRPIDYIEPGRWTVWIHDESIEELKSNRIEIPVRFTTRSVMNCLDIARDKDQLRDNRKWQAEWLQRIDSELKLDWPDWEATQEVKEQREVEIQKALQEFAEYWETAQNTRRVARVMAEINREAGLGPEVEAGE